MVELDPSVWRAKSVACQERGEPRTMFLRDGFSDDFGDRHIPTSPLFGVPPPLIWLLHS